MHVLEQAKTLIAEFVAAFDPAVYSGADAETLVARFDELERLAAAGKVLASRQVTDTGSWKAGGYVSKEEWYSRTTGTTLSNAAQELATAQRVSDFPETDAALRAGRLTSEQAAAVTSAAVADPTAERRLLFDANRRSLSGLRKECQAVRHAAGGASAANREVIHASRFCHHWTAEDGAFMLKARMTPEDGATLLAAMSPHRKKIFDQARKEGLRDPSDAYELDALVALAAVTPAVDTSGKKTAPPAVIVFRIDYPAYLRGFTLAGETSELVGVGPVPVETVRRFANDGVYRVVLMDGDQIRDLRTIGRNLPANLRRAVLERDPRCCVPGCERSEGLQIHHLEWVKVGGPTCMDNLARLCTRHHDMITYQRAHLAGPYPNWVWYPPGTKPAGIRGWYDPAPSELLDDLGIEHEHDPLPDPGPPGTEPPGRLF
jgi:hypothetical protein